MSLKVAPRPSEGRRLRIKTLVVFDRGTLDICLITVHWHGWFRIRFATRAGSIEKPARNDAVSVRKPVSDHEPCSVTMKLRMTALCSAFKRVRLVANTGEWASFNRRAAQHERALAEARNYSRVKIKVNHFSCKGRLKHGSTWCILPRPPTISRGLGGD
jgi:hypothetical protein